MHPGPDRAIRIVQNLGAGRPQNQAPVNSHALRRDHDQIGLLGGRALDNFLRRLPVLYQRPDMKVFQALVEEFFDILRPGSMHILERAVVRRLGHVQQDQLRIEAPRQRFHVSGSPPATAREIDGEQDSP